MSKTILVKVRTLDGNPDGLREFGHALATFKYGLSLGMKARAVSAGDTLIVVVQDLPEEPVPIGRGNGQVDMLPFQDLLRDLCDHWLEAEHKKGRLFQITHVERVVAASDLTKAGIVENEVVRERLTKRFLCSLPEGAFVVSNLYDPKFTKSRFAEVVGSQRSRGEAWERAKRSGAAQHTCWVVWAEAEFIRLAFPDWPTQNL